MEEKEKKKKENSKKKKIIIKSLAKLRKKKKRYSNIKGQTYRARETAPSKGIFCVPEIDWSMSRHQQGVHK